MRQAVAGLQAKLQGRPRGSGLRPGVRARGRRKLCAGCGRLNPRLLVVLGTPALMVVAPVVKTDPGGLRPGGQPLFYRGRL